jgi:hypothetical protein
MFASCELRIAFTNYFQLRPDFSLAKKKFPRASATKSIAGTAHMGRKKSTLSHATAVPKAASVSDVQGRVGYQGSARNGKAIDHQKDVCKGRVERTPVMGDDEASSVCSHLEDQNWYLLIHFQFIIPQKTNMPRLVKPQNNYKFDGKRKTLHSNTDSSSGEPINYDSQENAVSLTPERTPQVLIVLQDTTRKRQRTHC